MGRLWCRDPINKKELWPIAAEFDLVRPAFWGGGVAFSATSPTTKWTSVPARWCCAETPQDRGSEGGSGRIGGSAYRQVGPMGTNRGETGALSLNRVHRPVTMVG